MASDTTRVPGHRLASSQTTAQEALGRILAAGIADAKAEPAWAMLHDAQRIVILAHEHPDGDALGSALGLGHALSQYGKQWIVACADPVPPTYAFLPGHQKVVTHLPDEQFDLVVALDAGELERYGAMYRQNQAFFDRTPRLNIDHHITSVGCGAVTIIDPASAATAELLTLLLLNRGVTISRDCAVCLLTGIITDTRSFEFDATTERTLCAGAFLVGCGAQPQEIIKPVYRLKPLAQVRLWAEVLPTVKATADGRMAWAMLTQAALRRAEATSDMDDGLPSYLMDIEGVELAALFKEGEPGITRVSLRGAAPHDVAEMARHFGGGGHMRAAGCTIHQSIEHAMAEMVPYLQAQIGAQ